MPDYSKITFTSDSGLRVTCLLGEAAPKITGGYANWEVVDRPKRVGFTRYSGRAPMTQDIAVIFDGFSNGQQIDSQVATLELMALPVAPLKEPPKVRVSKPAQRNYLWWVITNFDWDDTNTIVDEGSGYRLRLGGIVHLTEFIAEDVISTKTSPAIANNNNPQNQKITVPDGVTLKQLAQIYYKDPNKYLLILWANPWLNPDTRAIIPAGTILYIPPGDNNPIGQTVTVP